MAEIKEELAKRASNIKKKDTGTEPETCEGIYRNGGEKAFVRLLRADEIECRVSTVNEKGLSLLLFKDARVDQKILDETFTPFGWKRSHQIIDGNLYCTVEIWDEVKKQWIAKQDVGTMSYSEKEKGQASDSFKRACFNWGVGRELYTAPFIWIPAGSVAIQKKGDRFTTSERFCVQSISYNEQREIASLMIVNGKGTPVYMLGKARDSSQNGQSINHTTHTTHITNTNSNRNAKPEIRPEQETEARLGTEAAQEVIRGNVTDMQMSVLEKELKRTGVAMETVLARYRIQNLDQMTQEIYTKALNSLKKSKTKKAA